MVSPLLFLCFSLLMSLSLSFSLSGSTSLSVSASLAVSAFLAVIVPLSLVVPLSVQVCILHQILTILDSFGQGQPVCCIIPESEAFFEERLFVKRQKLLHKLDMSTLAHNSA